MTHDYRRKQLVGEVSSCRVDDGNLYEEVAVASHRTGTVTRWTAVKRDVSGGDLAGVNYVPTARTLATHEKLAGYKLLLIND